MDTLLCGYSLLYEVFSNWTQEIFAKTNSIFVLLGMSNKQVTKYFKAIQYLVFAVSGIFWKYFSWRNIFWKFHFCRSHCIVILSQLGQNWLEIITVSQLQRSFFLLQYRPVIRSDTLPLTFFPNSSPFYLYQLFRRDERDSSPCETVSWNIANYMFISYYHYLQHRTEYVLCASVNECL